MSGVLRVVVTGDNHLAPHLSRLSAAKAAQRRQRLRDAFATVVTAAIERGADIFVQAGDLFDIPDPNNADRQFVAEQFQRLQTANILTCAVSGNHDMPRQSTEQGGIAPLSVYQSMHAIHYFHDINTMHPFLYERNGLKLAIAGLSNDPARRAGEDPLAAVMMDDPQHIMPQADTGLLIVHAAIAGTSFLSDQECTIQPESITKLQGFQVLVTGHIHAYQHRKIGNVDTIVCGPSERVDFGDDYAAAGYTWLELDATGLHSTRHIRLPAQPRKTAIVEAVDVWPPDSTPDEGTDRVLALLTPYCDSDTMVRARFMGTISREQYRALDLQRIKTWGQERCFSFDLLLDQLRLRDDRITGTEDGIGRGERIDPRDILNDMFQQVVAASASDDDRAIWQATRDDILTRFTAIHSEE